MKYNFNNLIISPNIEEKLFRRNLSRTAVEIALRGPTYSRKKDYQGRTRITVYAQYYGRYLTIVIELIQNLDVRLITVFDSKEIGKSLYKKHAK